MKVTKERNYKHEQIFKCETCDYKASSATVLKSHVTRKLKQKQLCNSEVLSDIHLSPIHEEISEISHFPPPQTFVLSPAKQVEYKCEKCSETFAEHVFLEEHMINNHISPEEITDCFSCGVDFKERKGLFCSLTSSVEPRKCWKWWMGGSHL